MENSKRFRLNKKDTSAILKVLGWTVATAIVVALINLTKALEVPTAYLWVMPLCNTILVALKKFFQEQTA